jgi:hypothetical protein
MGNRMLIPAVLSLAGFVLSLALHGLGLMGVWDPPVVLTLPLQIGVAALFLVWCATERTARAGEPRKAFNASLRKASPPWLAVTTGLVILYAVIGLFLTFVQRHMSGTPEAQNTVIGGRGAFAAAWMAMYALLFTLFYTCWRFVKGRSS